MIEYNYEIIRNEHDENTVFTPDKIPTTLNNLVRIEGPNSVGKSTLLHILAIGLYGLKNESIPQSLKRKMLNLYDSDHQKLQFNINISNGDKSLQVISQKLNHDVPEIEVYELENGVKKSLSYETFTRKYRLIYDIPENPTDRLNNLTAEIRNSQLVYGNKVSFFKGYLHETITAIRNSQDPTKLRDYKIQLEKAQDNKKILEQEIMLSEEELDMLKKATYYKYYNHYHDLQESLQADLERLQKQIKKIVRTEKKQNDTYNTFKKIFSEKTFEMESDFNRVTGLLVKILPESEKNHLNIWQRIDVKQVLEHFEFNESLKNEITHFKFEMNVMLEKYDQESLQKIRFYEDLINILEHYKLNVSTKNIDISSSDLINELKLELNSNKHLIIFKENIEKTLVLLNNLEKNQEYLQTQVIPKFLSLNTQIHDDSDDIYEDLERKIDHLITNLNQALEKCKYYESELYKFEDFDPVSVCNLGVGVLSEYSNHDEDQLIADIKNLGDLIVTKKAQFNKAESRCQNLKFEIERLEKKEPHKYQNNLDELNELYTQVSALESKIKTKYESFIKEVLDGKVKNKSSLTIEQSTYYDAVFKYLGKRLGSIKHIDGFYEVEKVDLIDKVVLTVSGKKIKFLDMGTGQSQSAYILSLLKNSDDRIIIALFDEIAMMDSSSLEPIISEIRYLKDKGKLLSALLVQKRDLNNVVITDL